jgi:anti-anti-sigma factor
MNRSVYDYDVIVIGAGIAGMVSAVTASALGKRVAVVEKSKVGGNCTNSTCIPSKALIRLSHLSRDTTRLNRWGLSSAPAGGLVGRMIMPHIRGIVQKAYEKDLPETFERIGINMISATASFVDSHRIEVNGRTFSARNFIIATGTAPFIPPIAGLERIDFLTNETLYQLDELPGSLIILGGGVDGLEYASAFGRLKVETTVVEMATRLLPMADEELVDHLLQALQAEGIRLMSGTKAVSVSKTHDRIALKIQRGNGLHEEILADKILVAVGRKPDLAGLALENAGVRYNARGIITNSKLQTSIPHIFACGDIAGPYQLASTAEAQGIVAATNAVLPVKRSVDYRNNVYVIFTEPPLAFLGLTEDQAREKHGRKLKVYRFEYKTMRRAMIDGNEVGMAKFLCDGRGRISGAHILGEAAAEVIHEVQVIKAFNTPLHRLNEITHAYPTYAQALVGRASQLAYLDRMERSILVRIALKLLPGYSNRLHLARERLAETKTGSSDVTMARHEIILGYDATPLRDICSTDNKKAEQGCVIASRILDEKTVVLDIRGSLNSACEEDFSKAFRESTAKHKNMILNFSHLSHMDADGAGLLVIYLSVAAQKSIFVAACALNGSFREVFRLTRLDEAIALFENEEEARRGLSFSRNSALSSETPSQYEGPLVPGWSSSVERLSIRDIPSEAMNINVDGRQTTSPVTGFGCLWDKRYRLRIHDSKLDPPQIISLWKSEFPRFWPAGNRFFPSGKAPIVPGTAAVLNLALPGGLVLATGLVVIYVDETSFSFITIQGHILSGWITFSSFQHDDATYIQVNPIFRASDPLMELGMRLGAAKQEDRFWHATLSNLARRLGVQGELSQQDFLIDPRVRWDAFKNIRYSAAIRSSFYMPVYMLKKGVHFLKRYHERSLSH